MRSIGHRPVPLGPAELSGVPNPRDMVIMMASAATLPPQGDMARTFTTSTTSTSA
jgi:hypothetical protein